MKKLSLIVLFAIPAITGWSLKNFNVNAPANCLTVQAAPSIMFGFFNAHREGQAAAVLMWKWSSTADVISFQIERSYDGEFFDPVGGQSNNHGAIYTWKDTNVLPGYLYYRVAANMSNGEIIYSDVAIVHIVQH
jgi:hypothetical protein